MIAVLDDVGWVQDVVVNERTGLLIDGHLRTELAVERGERTIPIVYVDLSPEEEATVLATLDPLAAMATVNSERLESLLRELTPSDDAIRSLLDNLASSADIELYPPPGGLTDPDDVPDVPDEPYVQRGEIYALGEHRVMCGDATVEADVVALLAGERPLLMITDPPYGVNYDPAWRDAVAAQPGKEYMRAKSRRTGEVVNDDRADWREAWGLFPGDVLYSWAPPGPMSLDHLNALIAADFEPRMTIIWSKSRFPISRGHYHVRHEPCFYAVRKGATAHWIGDRKQTTVWEVSLDANVAGGHSTQKPVECMERPMRNHEGDVYDPFVGSGTTIIAAERAGRRSFTMEIEPRYVRVAIERWQQFTGQKAERISAT